MSVEARVYLGPFLEVHTQIVPIIRDTCSKPSDCPRQSEGFCIRCGMLARNRLKPDTGESPDLWKTLTPEGDVFATLGSTETLGTFRVIRLGPNHSRKPPREFWWSNSRGEEVVLVTAKMISEEMQWFQFAFLKELELLRALKFPLFEIRWGRIIDWY